MNLVRNRTSEQGKRFWESVDRCTKHAKNLSDWQQRCPVVAIINRVAIKNMEGTKK